MRPAHNDRTPFGKYIAKLRIDRDQNMIQMAKTLNISPQSLGKYELGRLNIYKLFINDIIYKYKLNETQVKELWQAVDASDNYFDKISRLETLEVIDKHIEKHHLEERIPLETLYEIRKQVQEEIK